jgi:hypothetical protein
MTLKEKLKALCIDIESDSTDEIAWGCKLIATAEELSIAAVDTLTACYFNGPLFDGDVPSKSGRDSLLEDGLVAKVVVKGEQGYNACTQKGYWVLKARGVVI